MDETFKIFLNDVKNSEESDEFKKFVIDNQDLIFEIGNKEEE